MEKKGAKEVADAIKSLFDLVPKQFWHKDENQVQQKKNRLQSAITYMKHLKSKVEKVELQDLETPIGGLLSFMSNASKNQNDKATVGTE